MPWDFGAGVAAAAGAGAGLIGDSIKRERDLQGAAGLLALKEKVEQDKQARIAAIIGGVSRTKTVDVADESGGHTVDQAKPEAEYRRERGDALTKVGLIDAADREYNRADVHEDKTERRETAAAKQKSDDERWRVTEARQDKLWTETVRHNKAMEARAGADRISPAARAQLEMASTHVNSAHRAESEAAKALDAVRKNPAAMPDQVAQAEAEYKSSKGAVASALKQYDEIGAAHFGDKWKKASEVAPAVADNGAPIEIKYKGDVPYKQGPDGKAIPATPEDVARAAKQKAGGPKPAAADKGPAPAPVATGMINDTEGLHRANPEHREAMDEVKTIETRLSYLKQTDAAPATIRQVEADLVAAKQKVRALQFAS